LFPLFSRLIAKSEEVNRLLRLSSRILFIGLTAVITPMVLHGDFMMQSFYIQDASESSVCLKWGLWISLLMAFGHIYGSLLLADGSVKRLIPWMLLSISVTVISSYLLIPTYGALGSVWASASGHICMAVAYFSLSSSRYRLRMDGRILLGLLTVFSSAVLLVWSIPDFSELVSLISCFVLTGLIGFGFLIGELRSSVGLFIGSRRA